MLNVQDLSEVLAAPLRPRLHRISRIACSSRMYGDLIGGEVMRKRIWREPGPRSQSENMARDDLLPTGER